MGSLLGEDGSGRPLWKGGQDLKDERDGSMQSTGKSTADRGNRYAKARRWEVALTGSAGKRPVEMMPHEVRESWRWRGKHGELEAREDECYCKCSGNLLKGFKWGRRALTYVRQCVKNRLSWRKGGKGGSTHGRNCKMSLCSHSPLLPNSENSSFIVESNGPSQKSVFPIFLVARHGHV